MSVSIQQALLLLVFASTLAAAVFDVRRGEIPNRLILGMTLAGLTLRTMAAAPHGLPVLSETFITSLFGALICGSIPLALYMLRSLGGGDLKLLCATGVCLGPMVGFEIQLFAYGLGLVYGVGRVIYEGTLWKTLSEVRWLARRRTPHVDGDTQTSFSSLHFGPAVAGATLAVIISHWGRP